MAHPLLLGRCLKGAEVEDSARLKRNLTTTTYIGQQTFGKPMDTQTGLNLIQDYFRLLPGSGILLMKNASLLASPVSVSSDSLIPHILIVDDSSTIRHLLRTFISAVAIPPSRSLRVKKRWQSWRKGTLIWSSPTSNCRA
jgi:hypothetical protein